MTANESAAIGLLKLWPTVFLQQVLPDSDTHNPRLAELALESPTASVFEMAEPSVEWLKSSVIRGVDAYFRETGLTDVVRCGAMGRFEVQTIRQVLPMRNRPGAYLTGFYVVRNPAPDPDIGARSDLRPGCITFYDGRAGMNMNAIERDPNSFYHYTVALNAGLLLMWPAHVLYFVHPNLSREAAVRVAFDIRVETGEGST